MSSLATLFIVSLFFSSNLCQKTINKCCEDGEFLTENYECTLKNDGDSGSNHIPLRQGMDTNFTYGFPERCNVTRYERISLIENTELPDDYCVERFLERNASYPVIVRCRNSGIKVMKMKTFFKCCKDGMVFDMRRYKCVNGSSEANLFDIFIKNEAHLIDVKHRSPICSNPNILYQYSQRDYDFHLKNEGLYLGGHRDGLFLKHGTYCMDESLQGPLVARTCKKECDKGPCVSKCCPEGQVYQNSPGNCFPKCMPSRYGYPFVFHNVTDFEEPTVVQPPESLGIRYGINCEKYYLAREILNFLDVNTGELVVPSNVIEGPRFKDYCTEAIINNCKGGSVKIYKFVCKTQEDKSLHEKLFIFGICLYISCAFLFLTILVYVMLPQLRNFHGKIVMCHITSLLMAFLCLARSQISEVSPRLYCKILGYVLHYSLLAAFCWLNVMCIDIWRTFGHTRSSQDMDKKKDLIRLLKYALYAWGAPALETLVMFLFDIYDVAPGWLDPNVGLTDCWISTRHSKKPWLILFVLPVATLITANFVMFVFTVIYCNQVKSKINKMQSGDTGDKNKKRFMADKNILFMNIKLFMVMGMAWILELLSSFFTEPAILWYIGDVINILQGIPIFCILILKQNVFQLMKKRLGFQAETRITRADQTNTTGFTSEAVSTPRRFSNLAMIKEKSSNSIVVSK